MIRDANQAHPAHTVTYLYEHMEKEKAQLVHCEVSCDL